MKAAVFETIRVRNGCAPFLERHGVRVAAACRALGLALPVEPLDHLLAPWLTPGDRLVRVQIGAAGASVTSRAIESISRLAVVVAATRHAPYPFKVTDRSVFEAAGMEARAAGADDAVLVTANGAVAEGTTWNVFWWEDDHLVTPPLALGVLPGIARARVVELADVVEGEREPGDLAGFSLFATNAGRGIVPLASLGDHPLHDDPRTAGLAERFWPEA